MTRGRYLTNFDAVTRTFSNHPQWRDFMAAIHASVNSCAVTYPKVIGALRPGRAGFNRGTFSGNVVRACSEAFSLAQTKV
jgi:hypothetical protein